MAGETLQSALQRQFMAVIAVVSTCVGVVASCSITQKTHQYKTLSPLTCSSITIAQLSSYYYTAYTMHQTLKVLL